LLHPIYLNIQAVAEAYADLVKPLRKNKELNELPDWIVMK
jgi:hypothetical protein